MKSESAIRAPISSSDSESGVCWGEWREEEKREMGGILKVGRNFFFKIMGVLKIG